MPDVITAPAPTPTPASVAAPTPTPAVAPVVPVAPVKPVVQKDPRLVGKREAREQANARAKQSGERLAAKVAEDVPKLVTEPVVVKTDTPAPLVDTASALTPVDLAKPDEIKPETGIKVAIDPNHPALGGRKLEAITVQTPQEEQALRALLNGSYYRRQDVERRDQRITSLETELNESRRKLLQRESHESARSDWEKSPRYQQTVDAYHKIKESAGDEAAAAFWRGAQVDFQQAAQSKFTEATAEIETQEAQRQAQVWGQEAYDRTETWLPEVIRQIPDFQKWFSESMQSFDAELSLNHYPQVTDSASMHKAFVPFLQARLLAQPAVREAMNRATQQVSTQQAAAAQAATQEQQRIAAIRKQAVDEYLKSAADTRRQNPPNPLANLAAASRSRTPTDTSEPEAENKAPTSPHMLRKGIRDAARQMARDRFGQ